MTRRVLTPPLMAIAVVALTACMPPSSTVDGVDWAAYPAHANVAAESVLSGPSEPEAVERGTTLLTEAQNALTERVGVPGWDNPYPERWTPFGGNGYGGTSKLAAYTSPVWEATIDVPQSEWPDVIDVVKEIAAQHGLTQRPRVDEAPSEWMQLGSFQNDLEYFEVIVQDATLNPEELRLAESEDLLIKGIVLSYGATTVRQTDVTAFETDLEPFIGRERPPATSSD